MNARRLTRIVESWWFGCALLLGLNFVPFDPPWYAYIGLGFAMVGALLWVAFKTSLPV